MNREMQTLTELNEIPNVPYYPKAISKKIRELLNTIDNIRIIEDPYAIYCNYNRGNNKNKLIIDTHLDHPGFAISPNGLALSIGSIPSPDVTSNLSDTSIPVSYYNKEGELVSTGSIDEMKKITNGVVGVPIFTYPILGSNKINIQAIPNIESGYTNEKISMRSNDNLAPTLAALSFVEWVSSNSIECDITIIFSKLEEIHQISATHISLQNKTPFGKFDENTYIIVLEAATVDNPTNGIQIRIADKKIPYQKDNRENLAESLLLHAKDLLKIKTQHGSSATSNCNAISYSLLSDCPHVASLTIPCVNKHNFNIQGNLVNEYIYSSDLYNLIEYLKLLPSLIQINTLPHKDKLISNYPTPDKKTILNKKKSLKGALYWGQSRLKSEHLFSETNTERIVYLAGQIKSKISSM